MVQNLNSRKTEKNRPSYEELHIINVTNGQVGAVHNEVEDDAIEGPGQSIPIVRGLAAFSDFGNRHS